ncbi:MAG: CoA ester lyase [Xanthobacteraceae bacterium]|nr:CoA ester lyase [Xanthobacteraceae bacterium]
MIRPRRSVLFMPGSNARAIEKARTLPADGIILDLEDSVAPDAKAAARDQIAQEVAKGGFGKRELIIRVNHLQSLWWQDDFAMAAKARPDGILVPKILGPDDLTTIGRKLDELGADPKTRVWVMIETPLAVVQIREIAACALDKETRLAAFVIGPNDIALETRMRMLPGRAAMIPMFTSIILAARAYGVEILDGPYSDFSNSVGFDQECVQARDLGFDGKTLIHPSQVETANAVFTPSPDELARAKNIIAAFTLPENAGKGAIRFEGQMVERLHAEMAQRTIALSEAIAG